MRKAIVIGASSGIGKGIATALANNGYKVVITARRRELLSELKQKNPENFITIPYDIIDIDALPNHLNESINALGGLDLLVLTSGTGDINNTLDFNVEKYTIDTNVLGFTCIIDWAFNYFEQQKSGHIAAITSIAGLRGGRQAPSYNATKAYQINYLEALKQKACNLNMPIIITDIRPGFVDTAMAKGDGKLWVASVENATKQIILAIIKKKKVVYVTKRWRLIALIFKLMPSCLYEKL
jgi:short-subunit dehydrogenase